ncbi:scavenger receptor class b type-1 sr-b1 [Holotrichia oblita]|uniref:Scavenger receptor class b type-1 sr-b1 n=1 Tax=Holotrichia oblita TaxID=644536 RepID=A0ACB9T888_HOLOL|nr:scavenger receptor class b type-1 sr-b1 [Holotrichia oblita]
MQCLISWKYFSLHIERQIIDTDEATDTIKYHLKKHYVFNSTASGCRDDHEVLTIINMALMGTVLKINSMLPSLLSTVYDALPYIYPNITDIFLRVKVKDILFEGVTLYCSAPEISTLCLAMRAAKPSIMQNAANEKDLVFSIFGTFNDTLLGPFNITRGLVNTERGDIVAYQDDQELNIWGDGVCNMLNGSDGGLFFQMKEPVEKIYLFIPEICRSVGVSFDKKMERNGIEAYKYSTTEESLSHDGSNQCFCDEINDNEYQCPADGLVDLEPCFKAPKTATPLQGAKRTQMNVEIKQLKRFPLLDNVSEGVFPILWIEEGVDLPENLMNFLSSSFQKIAILDYIKWVLIAGGILLMLISFALVMLQEKLMCFYRTGKVTFESQPGVFTARPTNLRFNTSVVYPKPDNLSQTDSNANERGHSNVNRN